MEKNPIIEMMIFTMNEDQVVKSLESNKFKDVEVSYGAPEPAVSFTGKYTKVQTWCEDNLEEGFDEENIQCMLIDGTDYSICQVAQDEKDRWYVVGPTLP